MKTVLKIFENKQYIVELHALAPQPFWIIDKTITDSNPVVAHFYDEERAIEYAKGERVA
jgi:hypothetical protein